MAQPNSSQQTKRFDSLTKDIGPFDVTSMFAPGTNTVETQLIGMVGPSYGSPRTICLVSSATPPSGSTCTALGASKDFNFGQFTQPAFATDIIEVDNVYSLGGSAETCPGAPLQVGPTSISASFGSMSMSLDHAGNFSSSGVSVTSESSQTSSTWGTDSVDSTTFSISNAWTDKKHLSPLADLTYNLTARTNLRFRPPTTSPKPVYADKVDYFSVDKVGNKETPHTLTLVVDYTPPKTSASITGPKASIGGVDVYYDKSNVQLSYSDDVSARALTETSYDGGKTYTPVTTPDLTVPLTSNGTVQFVVRSTDACGNVEVGEQSPPIRIDWDVLNSFSPTLPLKITGTTSEDIIGRIHGEGSATVTANTNLAVHNPPITTVGGNNRVSGNSGSGISLQTGVPSEGISPCAVAPYQAIATAIHVGNWNVYDPGQLPQTGIVFVQGNLSLSLTQASRNVTIVVTGNVDESDTGTTLTAASPTGMLMVAGGSISIEGNGNTFTGHMCTQSGTISVSGGNTTHMGSLKAAQVSMNGAVAYDLTYAPVVPVGTFPLTLTPIQ